MKYELIFSDQSKDNLSRLKKDEPHAFRKVSRMLLELVEHPTTGTGKPELLKGNRSGQWPDAFLKSTASYTELLIQSFW